MQQENILDEIQDYLGEFIVYPNDHCKTVHTLWIVHTYLMDAFYSTPRLHITSATSGCGKTTLLNLTQLLVHKPMPILNPSPASLYTLIDQEHPTLLIDEIDTLFAKKDTFDITSIVNSGFDRSSQGVPRTMMEPRRVDFFNVFGPMMLVGIDKNNMPDTIENRCIQIRLRKKLHSETVRAYRPRKHKPGGDALREKLEKWITDNGILDKAKELSDPKLPEGLENRDIDKWEALLVVADVADKADVAANSGWGKKAREAALFFISEDKDLEPTDHSQVLLKDVRDIFYRLQILDISTAELLENLYNIPEAQWSSFAYNNRALTARDLARLLKPHGIRPVQIRQKDKNERGYYRASFEDAWERNLSDLSATGVTAVTPATKPIIEERPNMLAREGENLTLSTSPTKRITKEMLDKLVTDNPGMTHEQYQEKRLALA
jgi:Protein of unknown function (DUF3631)